MSGDVTVVRALVCAVVGLIASQSAVAASNSSCCFSDGSCIPDLPPSECVQSGGIFVPGESCEKLDCLSVEGRCCAADGSCQEVSFGECVALCGFFVPSEDCFGIECFPLDTVVCCFPDGECVDTLTDTCCLSAGGQPIKVFQGQTCQGINCPVAIPVGACCTDNGQNCSDGVTEKECMYAGGEFLGQGTDCDANECKTPCEKPGRPDDEGTDEHVLRGFIVGWAVNENNEEIRFNHLSGGADIINYDRGSALQYDAWAFQVVNPAVDHGQPTGTPGVLNFDGSEYAPAYDQLVMNFYAVGATPFNSDGVAVSTPTDLTLHPVSVNFTDEGGPVITKAHFDVWNENEVKFSGAYRCVTCWDQTLLGDYGVPNHFLVYNLQSNMGKARIDGIASPLCEDSVDAALLGVQVRWVEALNGVSHASSTGADLIGLGLESASLSYAPVSEPPEAPGAERATKKQSTTGTARGGRAAQPMASGVDPDQDRVSGSDKGSALYWSNVEIRWDKRGDLIQDTFLTITNDYPADVRVQLYFVNGDEPYYDDLCGEFHPGWNFLDNEITLTANQPGYWSAATGLGTFGGLSPFTVLDP